MPKILNDSNADSLTKDIIAMLESDRKGVNQDGIKRYFSNIFELSPENKFLVLCACIKQEEKYRDFIKGFLKEDFSVYRDLRYRTYALNTKIYNFTILQYAIACCVSPQTLFGILLQLPNLENDTELNYINFSYNNNPNEIKKGIFFNEFSGERFKINQFKFLLNMSKVYFDLLKRHDDSAKLTNLFEENFQQATQCVECMIETLSRKVDDQYHRKQQAVRDAIISTSLYSLNAERKENAQDNNEEKKYEARDNVVTQVIKAAKQHGIQCSEQTMLTFLNRDKATLLKECIDNFITNAANVLVVSTVCESRLKDVEVLNLDEKPKTDLDRHAYAVCMITDTLINFAEGQKKSLDKFAQFAQKYLFVCVQSFNKLTEADPILSEYFVVQLDNLCGRLNRYINVSDCAVSRYDEGFFNNSQNVNIQSATQEGKHALNFSSPW